MEKSKKLTDAEIVKALEELRNMTELTPPICNYEKDLTNPPYCKPFEQFQYNVRIALDLINRLQAEKQNLEIELKAMRGAANGFKAENERLKAVNDSFADIGKLYSEIKTEAYKECIEKVEKKMRFLENRGFSIHYVVKNALINLLKELAGDNDG